MGKVVELKSLVEATIGLSSLYDSPIALGHLINQFRGMAKLLKQDWNWHNTQKEQADTIKQLEDSADNLSKIHDDWMKVFHGHGVRDIDSNIWKKALSDFKDAKPAEALLSYENLIKTLDSENKKPLIAAKSKAAQKRLIDAWDTARSQLHGILSSFKGKV